MSSTTDFAQRAVLLSGDALQRSKSLLRGHVSISKAVRRGRPLAAGPAQWQTTWRVGMLWVLQPIAQRLNTGLVPDNASQPERVDNRTLSRIKFDALTFVPCREQSAPNLERGTVKQVPINSKRARADSKQVEWPRLVRQCSRPERHSRSRLLILPGSCTQHSAF